jgi:hypothetical protein
MRSLVCSILVVSAFGCGTTHVVPVKNVERATTVWEADEGRIPHLCLEYSSPAEKLEATKASLGVPIGNKSVQLTYESAESLATIYTVSEIMQFGHAALYRLCEAVGNGALDRHQFGQLFGQTLKNMNDLIQLQLEAKNHAGASAAVNLQQQIKEIDKRRCELLRSFASASFDAEWKRLTESRVAFAERYQGIRQTQPNLAELPEDRVGPLREPATSYLLKHPKNAPIPQGTDVLKTICGFDLAAPQ